MDQSFQPLLPRHLLDHFPPLAEETNTAPITCGACNNICLDAVIESGCGRTFCKKCLENVFIEASGEKARCPKEGHTLTRSQVTPNRAVRDLLMNITVFCVLKDKGCKWKGKYMELERHLKKECPAVKLKCQNYQCEFIAERKAAERHINECQFAEKPCKFCNTYFVANMLKEHQSYCPHQVILCPYACGESVKKKDIADHYTEDCKNGVTTCEFAEVGCQAKLKRHSYDQHIRDFNEQHMKMLKDKADFYKKQWEALLDEVKTLRAATKIEEIKQALKTKDEEIETLRKNLGHAESVTQNLARKNRELENTIKMLNNAEAIYNEDSEPSEHIEDSDEEEVKKDKKIGVESGRQLPKTSNGALDIRNEGWLYKESKHMKKWKRRWVVLTPTVLCTFENERVYSKPTERICVQNIEQVCHVAPEMGFYPVDVKMKDGKAFHFKTKQHTKAVQWLQEIQKYMQKK